MAYHMIEHCAGRARPKASAPFHSHTAAHTMVMTPNHMAMAMHRTAIHVAGVHASVAHAMATHTPVAHAAIRSAHVAALHARSVVIRTNACTGIAAAILRHSLTVALAGHRCGRISAGAMHVGPRHRLGLGEGRRGHANRCNRDDVFNFHRHSPRATSCGADRWTPGAAACSKPPLGTDR